MSRPNSELFYVVDSIRQKEVLFCKRRYWIMPKSQYYSMFVDSIQLHLNNNDITVHFNTQIYVFIIVFYF